MVAVRHAEHVEAPADDHIVLLKDATWSDYQRFLELRGERRAPRFAYLDGVVELMSPSQSHEAIKSTIGSLVETWCLERGIEFRAVGSWTLESKESARGVEPDECYVFGERAMPARPDLAIDVIWTSGGLDKRDIYRLLGVREVWFWRKGRITAYGLRGEVYEELAGSDVLPGIDLEEVASLLDRPTTSQAIREYRTRLAAR